MFVEPALEFGQDGTAAGATGEGFSKPAHNVATLVFGHLLKAERFVGEALVIGQGAHALDVLAPTRN